MKKFLTAIVAFGMVCFSTIVAGAVEQLPPVENEVRRYAVRIDGTYVEYRDQQPVLINYSGEEVLYVPMRDTYEALGFEVSWNSETNLATATKDGTTISFANGEAGQYVNGVLQTLDRPVRSDNGRTLVSAMSLTKSLGYILSWDDISGVLDIISPATFGEEFVYKQSTHLDANTFLGEYNAFVKMTEKMFVIPGLNEYVVPQGISYRADKNQFYLSGYFKSSALNSVICVIDAQTGISVGEYVLYQEDGTPFFGHVGGIAVTEKNLYIANGKSIYRVSLSTIDSLNKKAPIYPEESIALSLGEAANSFMDYSGGYLWVGNFYDPTIPEYSLNAHPAYGSLIRAYKMDETTESGFSSDKKTINTLDYDYIPDVVYSHDKLKIQGITTYGNTMYLSASYGKWGEMYVYDIPHNFEITETITVDGERVVPVIAITSKKTVKPIPRIEEIVAVNGEIYATFESGAIIYRSKSKDSTTDSVWKIPISKLMDDVEATE